MDELQSAIVKIKNKVIPLLSRSDFTPSDPSTQLFPMLDVWGDEINEDTQNKAKFIHESLGENPKDKLMSIFTKLGTTPPNERRIDRVYKYCRLQKEAQKYLSRYEQIQGDIDAISNPRR
jgi:hypothetical protein